VTNHELDVGGAVAQASSYTAQGTWPAIGGLMTWSINWDKFSNLQFRNNFDSYFG
jgi:chitinase